MALGIHPGPNSFIFMQFSAWTLSNKSLASPSGWPSRLGNPGSATDFGEPSTFHMFLGLLQMDNSH